MPQTVSRFKREPHAVRVVDPASEPFYRINGWHTAASSGWPYYWMNAEHAPCWFIGPISNRSIKIESLANSGRRHSTEMAYEKPCQHGYVEGSITRYLAEDIEHYQRFPFIGGSTEMPYYLPVWVDLTPIISGDPHMSRQMYNTQQIAYVASEYLIPGTSDYYAMMVWISTNIAYYSSSRTRLEVNHYGVVHVQSVVTVYDRHASDPSQIYPETWIVDWEADWVPMRRASTEGLINPRPRTGVSWWQQQPRWSAVPEMSFPWNEHRPVDGLNPDPNGIESFCIAIKDRFKDRGVYRNASRDEAIFRALENVSVCTINPIELYRDLKDPKQAIQTLLDVKDWLSKPRKTFPQLLKVMACLHLWWKYVVKTGALTLANLQDIARYVGERLDTARNMIHQVYLDGRGEFEDEVIDLGDGSIERTYSSKVVYRAPTNSISGWFDTLNALGFTPHLSDLWDIVKYSFVIDWVVDVGGTVERMEILDCMQHIPLEYLMTGWRRKLNYSDCEVVSEPLVIRIPNAPTEDFQLEYNLTFVDYWRKLHDELPDDMWLGRVFGDPLKHAVTAAALVVQYVVK